MSNNGHIETDTHEKATHFSKIGAYAGFAWCIQIVLGTIIYVLSQPDELLVLGGTYVYYYFGEKVIVFMLAWFLSLRVYSGKGYISAIALLICFVLYKILVFLAAPTIFYGLIINGLIAYGMYAGIRGTHALRQFYNNSKVDPGIFD